MLADITYILISKIMRRVTANKSTNIKAVQIRLIFQRVSWCCKRGLNSRPLPYQRSLSGLADTTDTKTYRRLD
jgi:hypothetical protein